eukprot:m.72329 g.72329  ORF g.72329 m.72329 type:complete len:153 (-) comp16099_c0_seq40:3003-3461(-)
MSQHSPTAEEIMRKFLLSSHVLDTIAFQDFENLFSSKYRGTERIRLLYNSIVEERSNIRDRVGGLISSHCAELDSDRHSLPTNAVTLTEALSRLKEHEMEMDDELQALAIEVEDGKHQLSVQEKKLTSEAVKAFVPSSLDFDLLTDLQENLR